MAKAPVEEFPQVSAQFTPQPSQNIRADPSAFGGLVGAEEQKTGAEAEQAGGNLIQTAILKQDRWNQIAVDHSYNQYAEGVQGITWGDPNDPSKQGFFSKRGQDALTGARPTIESLEQLRQQIRGGLLNDAQRLEFDKQSRYLQQQTARIIGAHADSQAQEFTNSVNQATIRNGYQSIATNYNDEYLYQAGLFKSKDAGVKDLQSRLGIDLDHLTPETRELVEARKREIESNAIETRARAWGENDPAGALNWLKTQQANIDPKSYLTVERELKPHVLGGAAKDWVTQQMGGPGAVAPSGPSGGAAAPPSTEIAPNLQGVWANMMRQEAGVDQAGQGRISPAGALGKAQVMPDTGRDISAKLGIPYDEKRLLNDHPYNEQIGKARFNELLGEYGSPMLAAAGYNAGERRVNEWLAQNGDPRKGEISEQEWASKIPFNETRNYVLKSGAVGMGTSGPTPASAAAGGTQGQPFVVGDSLATGMQLAGGFKGNAQPGAAPDAVLRTVQALPNEQVAGKHIVLSGGASNNPAQVGMVEQQVNALKQKGAAGVTIVGVGDRADLAPVNATLQQIAERTGSTFAPVDPATLSPDRVHPSDYRPLVRSAAAFGAQGAQPAAPALLPIGVAAAHEVGASGTQFPNEDQIVADGMRQFEGNPDMQEAVYGETKRRFAILNAEVKNQRAALVKNVEDTSAALLGGQEVPIPVGRIHALFEKDKADRIVSGLTIDGFAGQQFKAAQFGSQQDVANAINDLQSRAGLGPVSKLLTGKAAGLPGLEPAGTEGSVENYALRQQVADKLKQQYATRQAALATDPAAYAASSPVVAPLAAAADAAPADLKPAAIQAYAQASLSLQDQMGVPKWQQHVLTKGQAETLAGSMMKADPGTVDVGGQIAGMQRQYGDQWNRVWGDLVTLGKLPQSYQTLAVIPSATGRRDFQSMLQLADKKGGRAMLDESADKIEVQAIRDGLVRKMGEFRSTAYIPGIAGNQDMVDGVSNDVRDLAISYAFGGQQGGAGLNHAYQTIIGDRYDIDGHLRAPKGMLGAAEAAGRNTLDALKPTDLAPAPDTMATKAGPGLTLAQRQEAAMDYVRRGNGYWITNPRDDGMSFVGIARDGTPGILHRVDGSPVEVLWKNLGAAAAAPPPPLANPGDVPAGP